MSSYKLNSTCPYGTTRPAGSGPVLLNNLRKELYKCKFNYPDIIKKYEYF